MQVIGWVCACMGAGYAFSDRSALTKGSQMMMQTVQNRLRTTPTIQINATLSENRSKPHQLLALVRLRYADRLLMQSCRS